MQLTGYSESFRDRLVTPALAAQIQQKMPERLQLHNEWKLVYSLEQNGASLRTLYNLAAPKDVHQHGYVLAVKDAKQTVFGAYLNEPPHVAEAIRFTGNGDCFLWRLSKDGFQAFPYTQKNDFIMYCTHQFISIGGGDGHDGLWLDDSLERGVSYHTQTFDNEPLSMQGTKFQILNVELWKI